MKYNFVKMVKFESLCKSFDDLTSSPDKFLTGNLPSNDFKDLLKKVYDFNQCQERTSNKALPELIVNDFDNEQIWQELELQNEDSLPALINQAARLLVSKNLQFPIFTHSEEDIDNKRNRKRIKEKKVKISEAISSEEESDDNLEYEQDDNLEYEQDDNNLDSDENLEIDEDDNVTDVDELGKDILESKKSKKVNVVPSEVDDQFFKLSEMEAFLKDQEEKGDNLGVDLFNDVPSNSDEDDRPMFKDFFVEDQEQNSVSNVNEGNESGSDEDFNESKVDFNESEVDFNEKREKSKNKLPFVDKVKKVKFNMQSDEESDNEPSKEKSSNVKSSFELREVKLRKKIAELEDENLQEKAWPLKGEVSAAVRPVNSLLEEVVEFDMTRRPPPVITEETSHRLEDIIKQRIKDQAYDDVERKVKPVATPNEFKKKLVLDQEKSKLSLAEVYEKEYIKQKNEQSQDPLEKSEVEPEEHQIIKKMMKSLFIKLDALSNFFFVPKPLAPDLKIISNLPAVEVEEVAPVVASDAKLLAPEEISSNFKKSLVSQEEKTKTDKKRERRKKKIHQAQKFKAKELKEANKPASYNEELKKVMKFKNVTKMDEKSLNTTKSSADFFSKLQEEVKVPQKISQNKRKSKTPSKSAKKLKL